MLNDLTTTTQDLARALLGLPTTSWLRQSSFDKHCPCVGQWSNPTHPGQFYHHIRPTTFIGRVQLLFSSGVITPTQLQANHAPSVTPSIAYATCRNPYHIGNGYSSTLATRQTKASTPDMICLNSLGDKSQAVPALRCYQRPSQTLNVIK